MSDKQVKITQEPSRVERLGFRLDKYTKDLIERAAHLESRIHPTNSPHNTAQSRPTLPIARQRSPSL